MPKKKLNSNRLDKLFQDAKPEQTPAEPTPAVRKRVSEKKNTPLSPDSKTTPRSAVIAATKPIISPADTTMSLAFQAGQNNWATLQVVDETAPRSWTSDEQLLVKQVADQLSLALENARLFQETQRRAQEMTALAEVGREISSTLSLEAVLEKITIYAKDLLQAETCATYLPEPNNDLWRAISVIGNDVQEIKNDPIQLGRGILGNIAVSKIGQIVNDASNQQGAITVAGTIDKDFEHIMAVPILSLDQATGLMSVWRTGKGKEFSDVELNFLSSLGQQAAIAIENARLFEDTQYKATVDSLVSEISSGFVNVNAEQVDAQINLALKKIGEFSHIDRAYLFQFSEDGKTMDNTHEWAGLGIESFINDFRNVPTDTLPYMLDHIQKMQIFYVPQVANLPDEAAVDREELLKEKIKSILCVPIVLRGTTQGFIGFDSVKQVKTWPEQDINMLRLVGEIFTGALQRQRAEIENRRLFQEVTASQNQLSEALQIARLGYFEIDLKNQTVALTDELFSLLGTTAIAEGGYKHPLDYILQKFIVEEDVPIATAAVQKTIETADSRVTQSSEVRYKTKNEKTIWVRSVYKAERNSNGEVIKVAGSSQDINDRKINELIQTAITQISESALTATDIKGMIGSVHQAVSTLVPAKNFYVGLYDPNTDLMTFPYYADEFDKPMPPQKLGRGLTSYVIRTGKTLRTTPEIYAELEESGEIQGGGRRAVDWIGVPMRSKQTITGVVAVQSYSNSTRLTERHADILSILGTQVASAIERYLAEEALKRRNDYLSATTEIGRLVTSTLDLKTIFTRTVSLVGERFGFYHAAIFIVEETGFNCSLQEATGEAGGKMKAQKYSVVVGSKSVVGTVSDNGNALVINDTLNDPLYIPNPLLMDTRAEAGIPLKVGSRIIGVLDIQSTKDNAFTSEDMLVLQSLADQVAVAIDNARSYELSQQAVKELREVDQLKSQFLANMSHELRTPLNSIIGFSRVILKGIDGPVSELQHQDLTAIYNSGQHLLGLINDVLDLARIEAGKMELNFEEVNINELTTSVMSTMKGLLKEKPVELRNKIPADMARIRGDTMRVRQVLLNLMSNAAKFTDEGSITVEGIIQKGPTGKPEALINVIDTGPGISADDQKKLFQAFSQVDGSATRKSGGSGLGLSICANLVQMQGGRIGVSSEIGKGSIFYFTLPLFNTPEEDIPEGAKVILAIDDDPQVIGLYERYLTPQGYHVIALTEPSRAVQRAKELKPYAVTLDIMMPGTDGWTVLNALKSDPETHEIPVIICSIMEQTDKGFSLGAADYLVKPILEEDLVGSINRLNNDGSIREVLVIDDDPNGLRLIEKILNEHGRYKPILVEGGRKGWEAITASPPHAIILDLFMPDIDGFTILEKLRETPHLREIPVVVVSGGGLSPEQQKQLTDFGQRMITKGSFKESDLIADIESALKRIGPNK